MYVLNPALHILFYTYLFPNRMSDREFAK